MHIQKDLHLERTPEKNLRPLKKEYPKSKNSRKPHNLRM
jgi:hypothetical protein